MNGYRDIGRDLNKVSPLCWVVQEDHEHRRYDVYVSGKRVMMIGREQIEDMDAGAYSKMLTGLLQMVGTYTHGLNTAKGIPYNPYPWPAPGQYAQADVNGVSGVTETPKDDFIDWLLDREPKAEASDPS